jgi:YfiH family protein
MNPDWLQPQWPAPARVKALCTSRRGGASCGSYDSFNLGDHVGDAAVAVAANRTALAHALGVRPVFLSQVHGTHALALDAASPDGQAADAALSDQTGLACTIMVADCLPLLFYLPQARVVAAAHAGWRGLAGGVLENLWDTLSVYGDLSDLKVWLGPCIGPKAFEVGEEVRRAFCLTNAASAKYFEPAVSPGKYMADLSGLARQRLSQSGVTHMVGNDSSLNWCTYSNPDLYFSHRRDGISGRFAAGISLV